MSPQIGITKLETLRHFRLRWYFAIRLLETTQDFGVVFRTGLAAVAQHAVNARPDVQQEAVKAMRKRIGNLDFDCASHCVYHLAVHVVFCTKFRRHTLTSEKRDFLKSSMSDIAREYN